MAALAVCITFDRNGELVEPEHQCNASLLTADGTELSVGYLTGLRAHAVCVINRGYGRYTKGNTLVLRDPNNGSSTSLKLPDFPEEPLVIRPEEKRMAPAAWKVTSQRPGQIEIQPLKPPSAGLWEIKILRSSYIDYVKLGETFGPLATSLTSYSGPGTLTTMGDPSDVELQETTYASTVKTEQVTLPPIEIKVVDGIPVFHLEKAFSFKSPSGVAISVPAQHDPPMRTSDRSHSSAKLTINLGDKPSDRSVFVTRTSIVEVGPDLGSYGIKSLLLQNEVGPMLSPMGTFNFEEGPPKSGQVRLKLTLRTTAFRTLTQRRGIVPVDKSFNP
jgi:hypothetical protein